MHVFKNLHFKRAKPFLAFDSQLDFYADIYSLHRVIADRSDRHHDPGMGEHMTRKIGCQQDSVHHSQPNPRAETQEIATFPTTSATDCAADDLRPPYKPTAPMERERPQTRCDGSLPCLLAFLNL